MTTGVPNDTPVCRECGYTLEGLHVRTCPECGHGIDQPVSEHRRAAAALLYFACLIPLIETLVLIAWGIQHLLIASSRRNTVVLAVSMSVLSIIAMGALSRALQTNDRIFDRLRFVSASLAAVIGVGLAALTFLRPGGHQILLFVLALFNAGLAYVAITSGGVPVSAMEHSAVEGGGEA
jgi:hypothetical protein